MRPPVLPPLYRVRLDPQRRPTLPYPRPSHARTEAVMAEDTSFWRGRKALVTGCTGFLGGAVSRELLARGAVVVGLINERPAVDLLGPRYAGRVHLVRGRT